METTVNPQANQFPWTMSVIPLAHCHQLSTWLLMLTISTTYIRLLIWIQQLILFTILKRNLIVVAIFSLALSAGWLAYQGEGRLLLQVWFCSGLLGGPSEARLWNIRGNKMAASICASWCLPGIRKHRSVCSLTLFSSILVHSVSRSLPLLRPLYLSLFLSLLQPLHFPIDLHEFLIKFGLLLIDLQSILNSVFAILCYICWIIILIKNWYLSFLQVRFIKLVAQHELAQVLIRMLGTLAFAPCGLSRFFWVDRVEIGVT